MGAYLIRRLLLAVPILLGVTLLVFLMLWLVPGDRARALIGPFVPDQTLDEIRIDLGLDRPLPQQYASWLGALLHGDLGRSHTLHRPVLDELRDRLGPTLLLAGTAFLVSSIIGVLLGVGAALRQNDIFDRATTFISLIGVSLPSFWLGMLLIGTFSVTLGWFPVGGMGNGIGVWKHLVLPATVLSAVATAILVRLTRAYMIETLRQDYVRTARAKGLSETRVIFAHAFRNAIVAVLPVLGLQAGLVFGGAVYIETVFQWPGIGRMLVDAISTRDIVLVQGGVLIVAAAYVALNFTADIFQSLLDPRISRA